jgi:hypothetical protein
LAAPPFGRSRSARKRAPATGAREASSSRGESTMAVQLAVVGRSPLCRGRPPVGRAQEPQEFVFLEASDVCKHIIVRLLDLAQPGDILRDALNLGDEGCGPTMTPIALGRRAFVMPPRMCFDDVLYSSSIASIQRGLGLK